MAQGEMFGRNLYEATDQPVREKLNYSNKGDYRLLCSDTRQSGTLQLSECSE